jgi:hypothetical protein
MRSRLTRSLFAANLLAISIANNLHAQTTTSGGLTGVITDQSSAVLPNATVEIRDEAKGTTQKTKTDRAGVYQFFFLAPSLGPATQIEHDSRAADLKETGPRYGCCSETASKSNAGIAAAGLRFTVFASRQGHCLRAGTPIVDDGNFTVATACSQPSNGNGAGTSSSHASAAGIRLSKAARNAH